MKQILLTVIIILFSSNFILAQYTVETVPDPIKTGSYVSNPDGILNQNTIDSLNLLIKAADDSGYVQAAVVVLNSVGDIECKVFATELFNYWGIGHKDVNNGLLILMVMDQRTVSFETGYGIEDVLTDIECYTIQQDYMIPYFKNEEYNEGILNGTIVALLEAKTNTILSSNQPSTDNQYDYDYAYNEKNLFKRLLKSDFFIRYAIITLVLFSFFLIALIISFFTKDRYKRYQTLRPFSFILFPVLFPVPFFPILFLP